MPAADHVVIESGTMRGICQHCGRTFQLKLPCEVDVWLAAATAFGNAHRDCPEPMPGIENTCERKRGCPRMIVKGNR